MSINSSAFNAAPEAVLANLRLVIPRAVMPAFDQALLKTELWLSELSAAQTQKGGADSHAQDSQALQSGSAKAGQRARETLMRAINALGPTGEKADAGSELSLIDDEQMQMQLAGEYMIEKLGHFYRIGLGALDQRLAKVFGQGLYGPRMALAPQVLADAARLGLAEIAMAEEFRVLALRHFETLVDPVLSDLLKELNASLAAAGVLPNLVVQDPEEKRRREALRPSRSAAPPEDTRTGTEAVAPAPERSVSPVDQALMTDLIDLLRTAQAVRTADRQALGGLPERPMARTETLSVLSLMQQAGSSDSVLSAITNPGGSIAETLKRELSDNARKLGMGSDTEVAALAPEDETAVDIASNLFEVMLKDRSYAEAVAPVLARMFMPFVKAAVMDSQLFLQPEHPARQLLNTVSEACEDNANETPQEKELLAQVDSAVQRLIDEFEGNVETFGQVEQQLSDQMGKHRKRIELTEKRAGETQRGQERLEFARREAERVVDQITSDREMPNALETFLDGQFKHHLSITALRNGVEGEVWESASKAGKPWIDMLDMVSLGEPLPAARLESLKELTLAVLSTSGIEGEAAEGIFENLVTALTIWSQEDASEISAAAKSLRDDDLTMPEMAAPLPTAGPAPEPAASPTPTPATAPSPLPSIDPGPPPSEEELQEVRSLSVGTWLQMPKEPDGIQQLKVSWISGISGLLMLVNRRGARVMAIAPQEMVRLKRTGGYTVFQRAAPVDQAMEQMLDRLRHQRRPR